MSSASEISNASSAPPTRARRALVCAGPVAAARLVAELTRAGYEAQAVAPDRAARAAGEFAPDVVLVELADGATAEAAGLALVAQLRADPATHTLPLVLLFHADDEAQRRAALQLGADDYCALATPPAELRARLDVLLWRGATGRRNVAHDAVSAEIDDFMRLVDAARADIDDGLYGALALVAAHGGTHQPAEAEQTLAAAHDFFKLNLRRLDSVAFYGPTLLVVYLPRKGPGTASNTLAQLHNEFAAAHASRRLVVGLATFPADGREVETLIERAEAALASAPGAQPMQPTPIVAPPLLELDAARGTPTWISLDTPDDEAEQGGARGGQAAGQAARAADEGRERRRARAVRESKSADVFEASVMPQAGAQYGAEQVLAHEALAAAARERELRARGVAMPRRLLLAVSDAARMAQINLLLRSAGYEVRAAFDAHQALNLLRIARPDLLVLDFDLQGLDGLETLRRLSQQQEGWLALPVVLLLPATPRREEVRAEAQAIGARGFVQLPYDPTALLDAVRTTATRE